MASSVYSVERCVLSMKEIFLASYIFFQSSVFILPEKCSCNRVFTLWDSVFILQDKSSWHPMFNL